MKLSDGIVPRRDHRLVFFMKRLQSVLEAKKKNEKYSQVKREVEEGKKKRRKGRGKRESEDAETKLASAETKLASAETKLASGSEADRA